MAKNVYMWTIKYREPSQSQCMIWKNALSHLEPTITSLIETETTILIPSNIRLEFSNDYLVLVGQKNHPTPKKNVIRNGSMKFNKKAYMKNQQERSQCFSYVGYLEKLINFNFHWARFFSNFLICTNRSNILCFFLALLE